MSPHATYLGTRSFGCLDGLRALSIAAVVWHHAGAPMAWAATGRGFLGVDLFFVISGFLIVTLLLRERDRRGHIDLPAFYMRRSLRIVPLNYTVILLLWGWALVSGGSQAASIHEGAPWALLYLTNWIAVEGLLAITWSLAAEEQFYCAWPPIERWLRPAVKWIWTILIGASLLLSVGHAHLGLWPGAPRMLTETTFVPILLGVGLAHALHAPTHFQRLALWLGRRSAAPLVVAVLVAALSLPGADISGLPRHGFHLLFALLVAVCVIREDNGVQRVLRFGPLARLGTVSYGIYLLHQVALHLVHKQGPSFGIDEPLLTFGVGLLLTWGMAELSFRTIERWFLSWKGPWMR